MNRLFFIFVCLLFMSACQESTPPDAFPPIPVTYPETRTEGVVDTYFNVAVEDPYRWLEIDTAAEVEAWVKAQNEVTFTYLDQIPFRKTLRDRYEDLYNFPLVLVF